MEHFNLFCDDCLIPTDDHSKVKEPNDIYRRYIKWLGSEINTIREGGDYAFINEVDQIQVIKRGSKLLEDAEYMSTKRLLRIQDREKYKSVGRVALYRYLDGKYGNASLRSRHNSKLKFYKLTFVDN